MVDVLRRGLALAIALAAFGCMAVTDPSPKPQPVRDETQSYPPLDSALYGADPDAGVQGWLDNDTVVFLGFRSRGERKIVYPEQWTANLYAWNTKTGLITTYSEKAMRVCVFDGYVRYVEYEVDGGYTVYGGRAPAFEKLIQYKTGREFSTESRHNLFSCKEIATAAIQPETRLLLEKHGFLAFDDAQNRGRWRFHNTLSGAVTIAPERDGAISRLVYMPWNECYGFHSTGYPSYDKPYRFWELCPKTGLTSRVIPLGPDSKSPLYFVNLKGSSAGIVGSSNDSRERKFGLYLINARGVAKMFTGRSVHFSISVDGCAVAFGLNESDLAPVRPRIQVIELCRKG